MLTAAGIIELFAQGRSEEAERSLEALMAGGGLRSADHGHWTARGVVEARSEREVLKSWYASGFRPLYFKPCASEEHLQPVFDEVARLPHLRIPPVWVVRQGLVTLHLPSAFDLREVSRRSEADAEAVIRHCLASLDAFLTEEPALRRLLPNRPRSLAVGDRYERSLVIVASLLGDAAVADLARLPRQFGSCEREVLFFDPKPANYIIDCQPERSPSEAWRIDLDMLGLTGSVALQIILAIFSYPVGGLSSSHGEGQFRSLLDRALTEARSRGVEDGQLISTLRYHLVRNWSSAVESNECTKAEQMALLLSHLLSVEAPRATTSIRDALAATPLGRFHVQG